MAIREIDAISDAIIATEKEIAGEAWGIEDTGAAGEGDRSLEEIGDGLEGQHEAAGEDDGEGADDEAEGDEGEGEGEGESETEAEAAAAAAAKAAGEGEVAPKPAAGEQPQGRVPAGKLREANEARRLAEAERDAFKGQITTFSEKLDQALRRIDDLSRPPRADPPKAAEAPAPKKAPDIFEEGSDKYAEHIEGIVESRLSAYGQQLENSRVETSMAIAHAFHKDTFEKAFEAINKLNPNNPDDRVRVQRIYKSPNPGEALIADFKRSQTLAEVGDDPAVYRERVAKETREALMKDPEFRKAIVAEMRGEAARPGPDGSPRSETRLPGSLRRAAGSNLGTERHDHREADDSEQAVADAAWREPAR